MPCPPLEGPAAAAIAGGPVATAPGWRLWWARALAWALLLGGWGVLGALGHQHQPLHAAGLAPLALWWLAIASALLASRQVEVRVTGLRAGLGLVAALTALALWRLPTGAAWLWLAAAAWGGLLVAASLTVRGLRPPRQTAASAPIGPALAGAAAAGLWCWPASPAGPHGTAALAGMVAGAGLLLMALVPRQPARPGACQPGLFDCALMPGPGGPAGPADRWPLRAAGWSMLPMMASLAPMADWCGRLPLPTGASTGLHLAAMLLPAAVLARLRPPQAQPAITVISGLLVLGGLALLCPGIGGLMAASLLQGAAWSLAWGLGLLRPGGRMAAAACGAGAKAGWAASSMAAPLASAAAVLALGGAIDQAGPSALVAVHAVLAIIGAAGLLGWRRSPAPIARRWLARPG